MGHTHAYQVAAAAYLDQFNRAFEAGEGEPAKEAVEAATAATAMEHGFEGDPYEWRRTGDEGLDEDDEVEA